MFKSKLEVDKHVDNCLKKINNETERNLRCFSFAKLYFNVGEYEQAVRYINSYLSVKPKSPEGHNLLGRALEKLGKKEAALEAYRMSLQQDPKQNHLVIKVCELMAEDDVDLDQSGARYFCDLAQSLDPQNPAVFSLKERLLTNKSDNPQEVVQFLLKELESRPTDVNLRVRMLKHFLQHNMIKDAYKHASDVEEKKLDIFRNSLAWYEVFAEVLVRYQRDSTVHSQLTWEFWFLSVSVLDKLAALSLDEHLENIKSTVDYTAAVFNFDQTLLKASQSINGCPDKSLRQLFLSHYEAQLHFHLAVLAFKQAKKDLMTFKEAVNMTLPVWLIAYHTPPSDLQGIWYNSASETKRKQICHWHKEASYRCSQAGHILLSAAKDRKSIILEKAQQYSSGLWKEQFFKKLFVKRDQHQKMATSFFVSNNTSPNPTIKLPDGSDLLRYDEIAQTLYPDSLHHYVWMLLNDKLTVFSVKSFEGLQYTVKNLSNCAAETLNILDIQAFICCATICAKVKLEESKPMIYYNQDRPAILPASITSNLGTVNQAKFISSAYRMYKNEQTSNLGEIRLLLIKGIEVVRCVGNHGLDIKLLVNLADIFAEKSKNLTKQPEIEGCEARAEMYWKAALPLLEKVKNNQAVVYPNSRLFEYKGKEISQNESSTAIDKGKLFIAVQLMKKKEFEKAMSTFETLKDPYASFYQSQIYKHMADQKTSQNKGDVTSEMRSQNIILLSRARDCLYLTLDRLREPSSDRDHPLNAQLGTEIEKMERLLSRIDPDCNNRNECDGMSDENCSSDNSAGDHYLSTYTHTSFHNGTHYGSKHESHQHSTPLRFSLPRQEARPSPERLDAQLRQLAASKDAAINSVIEQNKMVVDLHKSLLEEFKGFKDVVKILTSTVDEQARNFKGCFSDLKEVKRSVDDLKTSVDDIQNINDMVHEMKKEINEIKKDIHKNPTQLSEEDLYVLDPDYNAALDYNINSASTSSMNPMSQLYPHYGGARLPQPPVNSMADIRCMLESIKTDLKLLYSCLSEENALASSPSSPGAYPNPALYPGLYPGLAYPFGSLGLPPQAAFLPSEQQLQQHLNALSGLAAAGQQNAVGGLPVQQLPPAVSGLPMPYQSGHGSSSQLSIGQLSQSSGSFSQLGSLLSQSSSQSKESPKIVFSSSASVTTPNIFAPSVLSSNTSVSGGYSASSATPLVPVSTISTSKPAPVNVVITSSDPLPTTTTTTTQPILSVTIPPQHIKGNISKTSQPQVFQTVQQPHNYQIPMPANSGLTQPSILSQPAPIVTTSSLLTNVAPPVVSAVAIKSPINKNLSLGQQIEKALDNTFSPSKNNTSLNRSNVSSSSIDEYDPRPDFKPIIPLPDEVPVSTGEEKETELFCQRGKLFRHINTNGVREWKERGVGNLKILFNPETGKVRLIMRRDQVHKICANHFLTKDMVLSPMPNNDRAYIWAANDFADEQMQVEKFCVRFKTSEEARKFNDAFELAKTKIVEKPTIADENFNKPNKEKETELPVKDKEVVKSSAALATPSLGGFMFSSAITPTFKPKEDVKPEPVKVVEVKESAPKSSPFANFTFGGTPQPGTKLTFGNLASEPAKFSPLVAPKDSQVASSTPQKTVSSPRKESGGHDDSHPGEFVPTAEFKPVIDMPDLVQVQTGEENAEVLFEERAKLFRYDTNGETKEWKERGVGVVKILKEVTVRIVMRRDQIHKVCCNHQVFKTMSFKQNSTNPKAVVWACQDFSEGVLTPETFTIRFKNDEIASRFLRTIQSAQTTMDEDSQVQSGKHHKAEPSPKTGFGEKFKAAKGSWECKNCYVNNVAKASKCAACETPKSGTTGRSDDQAGANFSFGVKPQAQSGQDKKTTTGWGDKFKAAQGSWDCKMCYVNNPADKAKCVSCESPKDGASVPADSAAKPGLKGVNLDTGGLTFSFGVPASAQTQKPAAQTQKPATHPGKTDTATQKTEPAVQKFSFNVPPPKSDLKTATSGFGDAFKPKEGTWECKHCYIRNEPSSKHCLSCESPKDDSIPKKESTGLKGVSLETPGMKFNFGVPTPSTNSAAAPSTNFAFGDTSANKTMFSWKPATTELAKLPEQPASPDDKEFVFGSPQKHDFEFKPRSPRRISSGQGDESDGEYVEEEADNIYFKPVIPLPDKVDVKTGEEGEDILYCHRAKLFRFVGGEWKERGIGDVKILKERVNGKLRVLMRREQVLKVCLNHWLTQDIEYKQKDAKTWLFYAADFSEGEISREQFCLRFKNGDIANEFKKAIDDAFLGKSTVQKADSSVVIKDQSEVQDSDSDDVEFVSETQVSAEEQAAAIKLGLPPKFFAYKQLPDCTCDQCKKDDEYLKELFVNEKKTTEKKTIGSTTSTIFDTPRANTPGSLSSGGSIFGTPQNTSFTFGTPTSQPQKSETVRDLLRKPALLTSPLLDTPKLGQPKVNTEPQKSSGTSSFSFAPSTQGGGTTTFSFGTPGQTLFGQNSNNIFKTGATNVFGATNASATTGSNMFSANTSIFGGATPKDSPSASIFGGAATKASTDSPSASIFSGAATKGSTDSPSASIFGAAASNGSTDSPSASIFGGAFTKSGTTGNIFGTAKDAASKENLFGTPKNEDAPKTQNASKNLFGGGPNIFAPSTTTSNIFSTPGTTSTSSSTNLFGKVNLFSSTITTSAPPSNLFSQQKGSIFSNSSSNSSIGTATSTTGSGTNIFASGTTTTSSSATSVFGSGSSGSIFGSGSTASTTFGGNLFGAKTVQQPDANLSSASGTDTGTLKESGELVLNCDTGLSFASLAAKVDPAFSKEADKKDDKNAFSFLGAGAPVFGGGAKMEDKKGGSLKDRSLKKDGGSDNEEEAEEGDTSQEHDPHFEPIVPLPDQIVVTTGEENETALFNERAKLFRFDGDTHEWKERGVGQIKVLHDPENGSYRLLLRREQVHKVVLNQRILPELELQPMSTSDKAWMWVGYNYTDETFSQEKLAVRFKNVDLARQFLKVVQEAVKMVKEIQINKSQANLDDSSNIPLTVQHFEDISNEDPLNLEVVPDHDYDGNYEDEDDEDDEEDEDERSIMFQKRCTLSEQVSDAWQKVCTGEVQVYYDPELYAARISVDSDSGETVTNTLIGMNTTMEWKDKECWWRGVEWSTGEPRWRTLKVTFASSAAAQEFQSSYLEGLNYAEEVGMVDELPFEGEPGDEN